MKIPIINVEFHKVMDVCFSLLLLMIASCNNLQLGAHPSSNKKSSEDASLSGGALGSKGRVLAQLSSKNTIEMSGFRPDMGYPQIQFDFTARPNGVTEQGTEGEDKIMGSPGNDILSGLGGDDFIQGGPGNDIVYGGAGRDILNGGKDSDQIFGEGGSDHLAGGIGNDVLSGGSGNDWLDGGPGDDILEGDQGNDVFLIYPGSGSDTISDSEGEADVLMCVGFTTGKLEKRRVASDLQVVHVLPNGSQTVIATVPGQFKTASPIIEEIRCNTTEFD